MEHIENYTVKPVHYNLHIRTQILYDHYRQVSFISRFNRQDWFRNGIKF